MQDGIIKGTGNSRLLKSAITEATTWEQFRAALIAGTLPVDLAGINVAGWQQIGMALSKGNLLSDATGALLGVDTPNAALSLLGRFQRGLGNEYVWEKRQYSEKQTAYTSTTYLASTQQSVVSNVQYASSISISSTGAVSLVNPTTVSISSLFSNLSALTGKYFYNPTPQPDSGWISGIVKIANGYTPYNLNGNSVTIAATLGNVSAVSAEPQLVGYVNSPDGDAYPPTVSDGYTYKLLGQIGNKVQITTGSYTGTGTYGSSNPITLPLGINAKILIITQTVTSSPVRITDDKIFTVSAFKRLAKGTGYYGYWDGTTSKSIYRSASDSDDAKNMKFYAGDASSQFNTNNETFIWTAIGD